MIWIGGEVRDDGPMAFDLRDRGLLLADGLFETLLVIGGIPFRLDAHLARMIEGAAVLRLALDVALARRAIEDLARQLDGPGVVRVTVTRGVGPRGLAIPASQRPGVFATAAPWSPAMAFGAQRLATSDVRRNDTSPLSRVKSLAYLDNVLALDRALAAGADDALVLSTKGRVASASAANLFALQGSRLVTPPVGDGVLPGITRALLLELAPTCGFEPVEASLSLDDLAGADAVLTTSSVRLVSTVTALDGRAFSPVKVAARIQDLREAVRHTIEAECGAALPSGGPQPA